MNWKLGGVRLWIVLSITWLLLVLVVMRPDREFPDYFSISKAERGAVRIAYDLELKETGNPTEAWLKTLQSPLFGDLARQVSQQDAASDRLLKIVSVAFLPVILAPILLLLLFRSSQWVLLGFKRRDE